MIIYVFGNLLVPGDNTVFPLTERLKKTFPAVLFRMTDPNEDFPPPGERHPIILDTVMGLTDVTLLRFSDLEKIEKSPVSPHDYDLLLHLLLLKKMGKIDSITIIGIPFQASASTLRKTEQIISSLL